MGSVTRVDGGVVALVKWVQPRKHGNDLSTSLWHSMVLILKGFLPGMQVLPLACTPHCVYANPICVTMYNACVLFHWIIVESGSDYQGRRKLLSPVPEYSTQ